MIFYYIQLISYKLMIIYTSYEVEKELNRDFMNQIKLKEKEIMERQLKTGKIQKWTAYAFVNKPDRIFYKEGNNLYILMNGVKVQIDNIQDKKGGIYCTDPNFDKELEEFIKINPNYKITFVPGGRYGSSISYYSPTPHVYPAKIESNGFSLELENEDNYDIICM